MHWQREREVGTANAKCEIHSSAKGIGVGSFQEGPGRGGERTKQQCRTFCLDCYQTLKCHE